MGDEDWGSWASKRERSYVVGLEVSVEERIAWLEEMLEIAERGGVLEAALALAA